MQLLQTVADYTLGQAYIVIKAISKKNKQLMAENEAIFKEGCLKKGIGKEVADALWELILPFAGYSFNRPHATLYGLLSYQTAWLKVNYPVEYMAAVLTGAGGVTEDVAKAAFETRRLGVALFSPDVNRSLKGFEIEPLGGTLPPGVRFQSGIRFGLAAIKNVGEGPVEAIIKAREEGGPFNSLEDLCARVDRHALNKRTVESLIKAGALDSLPGTRRQKLAILDQAVAAGAEAQKAREIGQGSLFDMFGESTSPTAVNVARIPMPLIPETPADKKEELLWEKELLGLTISEDPVSKSLEGVDLSGTNVLADISDESIGQTMTFIGVLSEVRRITTKKGDAMLVGKLEDLTGTIELVCFPKTLAKCGDLMQNDAVIKVTAKVDNRRDTPQLVVEAVEVPKYGAASPAPDAVQPEMDIEGIAEGMAAGDWSMQSQGGSAVTAQASPTPAPAPQPSALPPATPSVIVPRAQVKLNGNGNGKGNGKGNGMSGNGGAQPADSAPAPAPGRTLRLYLPRTDDYEADVRRMQDVYSVLRESNGNDQVTLYLPNGVGIVVLQSQHTISLTPGLLDGLRNVLGPERVVAE